VRLKLARYLFFLFFGKRHQNVIFPYNPVLNVDFVCVSVSTISVPMPALTFLYEIPALHRMYQEQFDVLWNSKITIKRKKDSFT